MSKTGRSALLARLLDCRSGVAMTEFALSAPLLFGAGLGGIETANLAITQMQVSQTAIHIADNASRIGDTSTLEDRKIYESDINDLFLGSNIQAGRALDIYDRGRVIVSSLEVVPDSEDQQYIHWQRCKGLKVHGSSYGEEGDGLDGSLNGMGPAGEEVYALDGEAVIFVEISYDYQPLVGRMFAYVDTLNATAAFNVRDSRDLSQIYQRDPGAPDTVSSCDRHDSFDNDAS
jgi:hypothetical protein